MLKDTFFGTGEQQAFLRRGRALYDMISADPRFNYYGRSVGLVRGARGSLDDLERLVSIQGASNIAHVPQADLEELQFQLERRGLSLTTYVKWVGTTDIVDTAQKILRDHALPQGLIARRIDADAPEEDLALYAEVSLGCGVLPLAGSVLRGTLKPGVAFVAVDASGAPVSAAASASVYPAADPELGQQAWWGSLATSTARRGERLSLILGAMAVLDMNDRFGFSNFMTGVQPGNAPSEAVCRKTGLQPTNAFIVTAVDASALPGGKMTS